MVASTTTRPSRRFAWLAIDVVAILIFVAVGRRNHDEAASISGVLGTAAPFLIALVASWPASRSWAKPFERRSILITWLVTVIVGLALRRLVFGDGIATPFIVVATITLGVLIALGRALAKWLSRSRS
ncbi:MAG: DUF3054 domain-containing protein [Actinobacteria bacterium]|nr:DUF3054 domain-containing protein [Actinomycetota bacterium]